MRPDMKVVFFDEWETPEARLKGATGILRALAGLAEKARRRRKLLELGKLPGEYDFRYLLVAKFGYRVGL